MNERMIAVSLTCPIQAAANAVASAELPFNATLIGASFSLDKSTGSPTTVTVDINDNGTPPSAAYTAVDIGTTDGAALTVKSTHLGGTAAIAALTSGHEVDFDVNVTGGSTPTMRVTVVLFLLVDEG